METPEAGPFFLLESDYDNLYILNQEWGTPQSEKVSSYDTQMEDLKMPAPDLDRTPWNYLAGYIPLDPWRSLVSLHSDAPRRELALHLKHLRGYVFQHIKTGSKLHWNGWTPTSNSTSSPPSKGPKPKRTSALQVFIGWTSTAEIELVKVAVSLFGPWENWCTQPLMFSDPLCQYASVNFIHMTSVGLAAGQYVDLGGGAYIHLTIHHDTLDHLIQKKVDAQLRIQFPANCVALQNSPPAHADFCRRILAGQQLGCDCVVEACTVLEKQRRFQAPAEPLNVSDWADTLTPDGEAEPCPNPPRKLQKRVASPPRLPPTTPEQAHSREKGKGVADPSD
jgi:hypothetical protein